MKIEMRGKRFGRFEVLYRVSAQPKIPAWMCRCDCGTTKVVRGCDLRQGKIKSCGCWHRERSRDAMRLMNVAGRLGKATGRNLAQAVRH